MYTQYTFADDSVLTHPTWADFRKLPLFQLYGNHTMHSLDALLPTLAKGVDLMVEDFLSKIFDQSFVLVSLDGEGGMTRSVRVTDHHPIDVRRALRLFRDENDWTNAVVFVDKVTFYLQPITRHLTCIEFKAMFVNRTTQRLKPFIDRLERIQLIDEFLLED